jgi:hypothetical protein
MVHSNGQGKDDTYSGDNRAHFRLFLGKPTSTDTRLVLAFRPAVCCGVGSGLQLGDTDSVPAMLAAQGVTAAEWHRFADKLRTEVQPLSTSICCQVAAWMTVIGGFCICARTSSYQQALAAWTKELNTTVLEPKGMFAKTQTSEVSDGKNSQEVSWLAVAIGKPEVEALKGEAVFFTPKCCKSDEHKPHPCACCFACCCRSVV